MLIHLECGVVEWTLEEVRSGDLGIWPKAGGGRKPRPPAYLSFVFSPSSLCVSSLMRVAHDCAVQAPPLRWEAVAKCNPLLTQCATGTDAAYPGLKDTHSSVREHQVFATPGRHNGGVG
jgi:hypothetical protein